MHRLDRDTSGLLVVAKSAAAARELAFAFQQHRVRKLYWAVLLKGPERNHGLIDVPLVKAGPAGQEKMRVRFKDDEDGEGDGRNARTRFMVLARAGKVAAWTALVPLTGRTHQLRAHAAAIGCPILGDGKYGGKAAHPTGAPKGLMLHARQLELPGPGRRPLRLAAEPPREFKEGLRLAGARSARAARRQPRRVAGLDSRVAVQPVQPDLGADEAAERLRAGVGEAADPAAALLPLPDQHPARPALDQPDLLDRGQRSVVRHLLVFVDAAGGGESISTIRRGS